MFKLILKILNIIFNYDKGIQDTNQKKDIIQNITETEIADKFESYFMDCFGYESCTRIIEDYNEFKLDSKIVNYIINIEDYENEFQLKKNMFRQFGEPEKNKKVALFKFYRKVSKHIYEHFHLVGYFPKENTICLSFFNEKLFNHYKFSGEIPTENNLNLKNDSNRNKIKRNINICNSSYYFYNFDEDKLGNILYLPATQIGFTQLSLRDSDKETFFSHHKVYSIEIVTDIDSNSFCSKAKGFLYYGTEILREFQFDLYSNRDVINAIEKLLFPFFLSADKKIELGLENITLDQIKNNFEKEFEIYKISRF